MKRGVLPKKTLRLWQVRVVMLTLVLVGACLFYDPVLPFLKFVAIVIAAMGLIVTLWYLPTFFKGYEMLFKNEAIVINYGVLIKFSHIMPYSRLIYAQSFATPLAHFFGVTALSLKAARSRVIVPEIELSDAINIMDTLAGEVRHEK